MMLYLNANILFERQNNKTKAKTKQSKSKKLASLYFTILLVFFFKETKAVVS